MSPGLNSLAAGMQDMAQLEYAYARVMCDRMGSEDPAYTRYYTDRAIHHQIAAARISRMDREARGVEPETYAVAAPRVFHMALPRPPQGTMLQLQTVLYDTVDVSKWVQGPDPNVLTIYVHQDEVIRVSQALAPYRPIGLALTVAPFPKG